MIGHIWIGGPLRRSESYKLVLAVQRTAVSTGVKGFEHIICQPKSIEGLLEAIDVNGRLHLQHPEGKLELLTRTCRELGLTYRLWCGATAEEGARVEVWWPGLLEPLLFCGASHDPHVELVEARPIRRAVKLLKKNKLNLARQTLQQVCPDILDVPRLELVED